MVRAAAAGRGLSCFGPVGGGAGAGSLMQLSGSLGAGGLDVLGNYQNTLVQQVKYRNH